MKNLNTKWAAFILFSINCSVLLTSCNGFVAISRTEGFAEKRKNIDKIMYIAPQVVAYKDNGFERINPTESDKFQRYLQKELKALAGKKSNRLEIINIDPTTDISSDVFQSLLPLRNELLLNIQMQNNPLNTARSDFGKSISKQVFVVPVKISPEWSNLSKKYGTPYFGFIGAFTSSGKSVVINYVFDVNKGEIIYQSIAGKSGKLNQSTLSHFIYDSVLMMNKSR